MSAIVRKLLKAAGAAKPRAKRIVVCALDHCGAEDLLELIRSTAVDAEKIHFDHVLFSNVPFKQILRKTLKTDEIYVIYVVRDPRTLLTIRDGRVPNDFLIGYDHSHTISDHRISFTGPGVVKYLTAVDRGAGELRSHVVRWEDLVEKPETVQAEIGAFARLSWSAPFTSGGGTLQQSKPKQGSELWQTGAAALRLWQQFSLEPKLFELLSRWGYENDRAWFDAVHPAKGTPEVKPEKIVAFHTRDDLYEREARRMKASADRIGLNVLLTPIDTTGDWVRNASKKGGFLIDQRKQLRGPLLYVDVDAVFHANPWPYLMTKDCDIAVFVSHAGQLISSIILVNDTQTASALLQRWAEESNAEPDIWDQRVLQRIVETDEASAKPVYRVQRLPQSYCCEYGSHRDRLYGPIIVEQLQASRSSNEKNLKTRGRIREALFKLRQRRNINQSGKLERRLKRIEQLERDLGIS